MKAIALLVEKVTWTYVQSVTTLLLAGGALTQGHGLSRDLAISALPAALTVLANGLPAVPVGLPFYVDLFFRTARTGAVSFIGFLTAQQVFSVQPDALEAAKLAAIMSMLAIVKGGVARQYGSISAATLPESADPQTSRQLSDDPFTQPVKLTA